MRRGFRGEHILTPLSGTLVALICVLGFLALGDHLSKKSEKEKYTNTYKLVSLVADINKDGTMPDEWAAVYKEVNEHFDYLNPKPLKQEQMDLYLSKHKIRLEEIKRY